MPKLPRPLACQASYQRKALRWRCIGMLDFLLGLLLSLLLGMSSTTSTWAGPQEGPPALSPEAQAEIAQRETERKEREAGLAVDRLLRERESALIRYNHMLPGLRTAKKPDPKKWAPRFWQVHARYPKTRGAARALIWIVRHLDEGTIERQARAQLLRDHGNRPELAPMCSALSSESRPGVRQDLEHLLQHTPIPAVKAAAMVQLCRLDLALWQEKQGAEARQRLERRIPQLAAAYSKQLFEGRTGKQWADLLQRELALVSLGQAFVDWRTQTLAGEARSLASLRDRVVILFFWKSSAPACRRVLPHIEAFRNQHPEAPLQVIGVSGDVDRARAQRWARILKLDFEQWHGAPRSDGRPLFGVEDWPAFFVLDGAGKLLAARVDWAAASRTAEAELQRLAQPPPSPNPDEPDPTEAPREGEESEPGTPAVRAPEDA